MDTNPWLLALTAVVTIFHSIFDFLAFKNGMTLSFSYQQRRCIYILYMDADCAILVMIKQISNSGVHERVLKVFPFEAFSSIYSFKL